MLYPSTARVHDKPQHTLIIAKVGVPKQPDKVRECIAAWRQKMYCLTNHRNENLIDKDSTAIRFMWC